MSKNGMLFGAPDADHDQLLKDCMIEGQVGRYAKPVLIGRWGTGKSANLIARARDLENAIERIDKHSARDWYIREQDISTSTLFDLHKKHSESKTEDYFINEIQEIWKSEITQRVIRVLLLLSRSKLKDVNLSKDHWKEIKSIGRNDLIYESMWNFANDILSLVFTKDSPNTSESFKEYHKVLRSEKLRRNIQLCISDLEDGGNITPVIGIEPIETPASELDRKVNMAECVIAALLNVYRNDYILDDRQRLKVFISIPWNRTNNKKISLPQHTKPYMDEIKWTKENLRRFIVRRIDWESTQRTPVRPHAKSGGDSWDVIFPNYIKNETSSNEHKSELSFDYVIRHTQWRARDIQTIARSCVIKYCNSNGITIGSFFRNKKIIDEKTVKDSVSQFAKESTEMRLEEARRRFSGTNDKFFEQGAIQQALRGMRVPFTENDLQKRLRLTEDYQKFSEAVTALWESGVIGIEILSSNPKFSHVLESSHPESKSRHIYRGDTKIFFMFQYNCSETPQYIKGGFGSHQENGISFRYVLHPCFFETLESHVGSAFPIGV